jgi:hypothetical protein
MGGGFVLVVITAAVRQGPGTCLSFNMVMLWTVVFAGILHISIQCTIRTAM